MKACVCLCHEVCESDIGGLILWSSDGVGGGYKRILQNISDTYDIVLVETFKTIDIIFHVSMYLKNVL